MTDDAVTDLTRGVYRRLYSGFITGQRINKLSLQAEAWFWRVLATVDDFGNGHADPDLCRAATVGKRKIPTKQISEWLRQMKNVGLIEFYTAKGEPYLHIVGFEVSQPANRNGKRIRRFPVPDESGCIQVNPDLSGSSGSDTENENGDDTEKAAHAAKPRSPSKSKVCDEDYIEELQASEAYGRLNVRHVLAKMVIWCENNRKQPTRSRLLNWLSREDLPISISRQRKPSAPVPTAPRPAGVCDWRCACGFNVLQNGNGITKCPDCGKELKPDGLVSVGSRKAQG